MFLNLITHVHVGLTVGEEATCDQQPELEKKQRVIKRVQQQHNGNSIRGNGNFTSTDDYFELL
jgi:hypothetical protein